MAGGRDLPEGVITFVFTDIEGSTRLLRELGDRYAGVLDLHHEVLREVWAAYGGHEVSTDGDAFFVAFDEPDRAVAAAVAAQRALAAAPWPRDAVVRVRMGLHTGFARPRNGDYAALAVHQAARIVDAAHGGQVLLSGDTAARVGRLPDGVALERLGRFRVRDFEDPPELHRVRAAGLEARDAAPRVRPDDGHNLVRPVTSLVGRDADLEAVAALVRPGTLDDGRRSRRGGEDPDRRRARAGGRQRLGRRRLVRAPRAGDLPGARPGGRRRRAGGEGGARRRRRGRRSASTCASARRS